MGVAALVLGIVSIVFAFLYPLVGVIAGIVGIILGNMAKKDPATAGMGTAGFVLSIIGTVLCLLFWIMCAAVASSLGLF